MNSLRRIIAVGLPTAGLTVAAALALGTPALATADQLGRPVTAATTEAPTRGNDGYATPAATDTAEPTASPAATDEGPTRGNPGYGSTAPTTPATTSPTPGVSVDTVPPGVSPSSAAPAVTTTPGGGVSAGGALPVTGAPMGALVSVGALLVAAGGASVWYTRRRRTA